VAHSVAAPRLRAGQGGLTGSGHGGAAGPRATGRRNIEVVKRYESDGQRLPGHLKWCCETRSVR
jgi:hypothetical protein